MKNILFVLLLIGQVTFCQSNNNEIKLPSSLVSSALVFANSGILTVKTDSLLYVPNKDCYGGDLILNKLLPCQNYLIKPVKISWSDVKTIKRRNLYLIFPNRFLVVMANGTKYKFFQYHRNEVIAVFDNYKKKLAMR